MKKLFIILLLISFILLPFKVFASVDITLEDKSTTEQKSVGIMVDTGTDVLDSISFKIQASTDVTVSQVIDQNSTCKDLTYVNASNIITVTCTMEEAKVISAYVGTIIFTSTSEDYTFTILKSDGLDIGTLTLGTVTDIEAEETNTEQQTTTTPITTAPTTTSTTTSSITKYLPYILIGGAVILLISIIGILFSKKKTPEAQQTEESTSTPEVPTEPMSEPVSETTSEPVEENIYTPPVQPQEPVVEPQPTIQEKLEQPAETPPTMPVEQPIQESTVPPQQEQSSDLSALINAEQQTPAPVETPPTMPVEQPIQEPTMQPQEEQSSNSPMPENMEEQTSTPIETPVMPVEETPTTLENQSQPLTDLQQLVNTQTQEEGIPVPPSGESVPQPTEEVPPAQQAM